MNRNFLVSLNIEPFCSFFVALKLVKCLFTQTLLDYKLCYDRHTECLSFILNKRTVLIILFQYNGKSAQALSLSNKSYFISFDMERNVRIQIKLIFVLQIVEKPNSWGVHNFVKRFAYRVT